MDPRRQYQQASGQGASGVRLVVLLYEQIIHDLRRAIQAIERHEIEDRTNCINHALQVISHLQCTLDISIKANVIQNLARFYHVLRNALVQAQAAGSREILEQQIAALLQVREAWVAAGEASAPRVAEKTETALNALDRRELMGWKG